MSADEREQYGFVTAADRRLEFRWVEPIARDCPVLVFLHEGLGSIAQWKTFPDAVAAYTQPLATVGWKAIGSPT